MKPVRLLTIMILSLVAAAAVGRGGEPDDLPAADAVVPELYATGFDRAEGLALDAAGNLYVAGYRGDGNIGRITTDGTASVLCTLDSLLPMEGRHARPAGLKIDSEGRLIAADVGCGRLLRISADGTECEVLADRADGVRFRSIRDVALDLASNIFFTDPGGSSTDTPTGAVYLYDINTKKVTRVAGALAFPSGVAVSPDQRQLCVSDSYAGQVWMYDLSPDGSVADGRVLYSFEKRELPEGGTYQDQPGGIAFDARGRLFVAMRNAAAVIVLTVPDGQLVRQYPAGGLQATSCHFHGKYLYTTIATKEAVFRLRLGVTGFDYAGP